MGKLKDLEIRYQNPPVYAGQLLRGFVCFDLKEPTKLRDLSVWVEGQTKVALPGGDSSEEKWLIRSEVNLNGYLNRYNFRLPAGFHQIPYAFPVPHHLPSSFGEKHGYIYYCCRLTINGRSKTHKSFTVIGVEDLNWHPYAALPINIKERAAVPFWSLFNKAAYDVDLLLQLERTGFVPGDVIRINAEVINRSNRKVKRSMVELKQGLLYKTPGGRQREFVKIVETLKRDGIPPGSIDRWEDELLTIPALPPSFMRGSEFVSVKYELIFTVDPGICLTVPIIIGTIPFYPESLNRGSVKALPWKEPPLREQRNGSTNFEYATFATRDYNRLYIEQEPVYVKQNSTMPMPEERSFIKIEEID